MNTIYTLKETADILKTSVKTTQRLIDSGQLKAFKLATQWRIAESSIDQYINDQLNPIKQKRKTIAVHQKTIADSTSKEFEPLPIVDDLISSMRSKSQSFNVIANYLNEQGHINPTSPQRIFTSKSVNRRYTKIVGGADHEPQED